MALLIDEAWKVSNIQEESKSRFKKKFDFKVSAKINFTLKIVSRFVRQLTTSHSAVLLTNKVISDKN